MGGQRLFVNQQDNVLMIMLLKTHAKEFQRCLQADFILCSHIICSQQFLVDCIDLFTFQ